MRKAVEEEINPLDVVEVLWIDSHKFNVGWVDAEDIQTYQDVEEDSFTMHTAGYFYEQTETFTYILQSYDCNEDKKYDSLIAIPNAAIISIKKLK